MLLPRTAAPDLTVPLASGGTWTLADQRPTAFTLIVFYRGLHCPKCHDQLVELDELLPELAEVGVDAVLAVSGDGAERAASAVQQWGLSRLQVGYDLSEEQMRTWGLFLSHGIKEGEPALFNEPALALIDAQGQIYSVHVQSTPFARPHLRNLIAAIGWIREEQYPARGEVR